MLYYILSFLIWIAGIYADNCVLLSSFDFKKKGTNRMKSAAVLTLFMLPFITIKYVLYPYSSARDLSLLSILVISVVYMHFKLSGKLWQKILFVVLQEVAFFSSEILIIILFNDQISINSGFDYHTSLGVILSIIINIAGLVFYLFVLQIWKRVVMKRSYTHTGFLVFSLFPISQILLTYASNQLALHGMPVNVTYNILGTIVGFIADGFLIVMLLRQQHMHETDQQLKDLQRVWEIEQNHYHEIETRREELAKIRHDLRDQLLVMRELTTQQEYDQILTMLNTLTDYVAGTKENVYCADSVVNAIMAENERKCEANDITLEYDLNIPIPLQMNPVVICNLFSNLFRNAIRAVCEIKDPAVTKRIVLKATLKGNYLHIKMENPYTKPDSAVKKPSGKPDRRHYGLEILQDIAELQNGQMDVTTNNGLYVTQISLENSNQAL